ncbi:deoxynucleoside kinase [Marinicella rhabdoformis]|uniref:deoxynucleoside kinase n=1 Tax=Marinicella rhabdoformis TaxID=2580566 RepID=UPI0012AEBCC7|nr:deoxynucleoside kinase [Marinicella rhabdoformis]
MITNKVIGIAGNIGVGKTSLVEFLTKTYDITPFYEPNDDNPYLDDFYQDMKAWGFHSQLYFLASKFKIHQQLDATPGVVIQDRTLFEDVEIFATALYQMRKISKRDWQTYQNLYQSIQKTIKPPDLMIYLKCSVRTMRKRIKLRGRAMEQDIPLAYLKRLEKLYENWINSYREKFGSSKVLMIETDRLDYVNDMIDQIELMKHIEQLLKISRQS